ncbi:putative exported enzyme and transporter [Niallia circulans]|uniref:sulfatase family protein n=1 Tax=Shouchella clausii TaxID=79880 RepID=UPI000BA7806D|nr:sulfatase [Shouchella clausii]MCM3549885.1 sulfatase [Shouchella clausii]PAF14945.1 N-sulfoglucosamine sulfohydrolase [Shouchella clausii]SPU20971.1 putative exported enzyme and transporter [Niallia circulans]
MKKNVIYIHTHDSGKVLSPYGYDVPTPSLQKFAEDATIFRQAYCVGPTCSPSRAGLLTGMYPHSNGMYGLSQRGFKLHDYNQHLVNFLKKEDYFTVLCGIQHEAGSYIDHDKGAKIIGYDQDITSDNTGLSEQELVKWDYENARQVRQWLQQSDKKKPFFLSYGMFATHRKFPEEAHEDDRSYDSKYVMPPYPVPDNKEIREDYTGYLNSATWVNASFGLVIETLKEEGLYDNSIIIFTTDHGLAFPFSKCTLYDSGIGVSLIMRVPESSMIGEEVEGLVSQVDVFPTLCDLLEIEQPSYLQGVSFAEMFHMKNHEVRKEVFAEINYHTAYEPARSIRTKRYKYIKFYDDDYLKVNRTNIDNSPTKTLMHENGLEEVVKPKEGLYDLLFDPGERNNLAGDKRYEKVLNDMRKKLHDYQTKTEDPILTGHFKVKEGWKVNKSETYNPSSKDPHDYLKVGE